MNYGIFYSKFRKNKKANVEDWIFLPVIIFVTAIMIIIGKFILNEWNTAIQGLDIGEDAKNITSENNTSFVTVWDSLFLFIYFGVWLYSLISAMFIRAHPAFFFLAMILMVVMILVNVILANTFNEMMSTDLAATASQFPIMAYLMGQKFPLIMLFLSALVGILLYAKSE